MEWQLGDLAERMRREKEVCDHPFDHPGLEINSAVERYYRGAAESACVERCSVEIGAGVKKLEEFEVFDAPLSSRLRH